MDFLVIPSLFDCRKFLGGYLESGMVRAKDVGQIFKRYSGAEHPLNTEAASIPGDKVGFNTVNNGDKYR